MARLLKTKKILDTYPTIQTSDIILNVDEVVYFEKQRDVTYRGHTKVCLKNDEFFIKLNYDNLIKGKIELIDLDEE